MRHFLQQAKDFYIKDFLTTKGMWRKPYKISILVAIIENIQLFSLITQSLPALENASYLNPIHMIMDLFRCNLFNNRIYPIIGDAIEVHIIYILIGFVLTFLSFIFLVYLILNTKSKVIRNLQLSEMTLERDRKKRVEEHSLIMFFISVYMQIYQTIIRIPMQYSHLHLIYVYQQTNSVTQFMLFGTIISFLSIAMQFLFSFFIDLHCFEFRMKKQDYLGKFNNYEIHIIFAFQTGIIILAGLGVTSILIQIIYLIYLMIDIFVSYQQLIYVEIKISRLQLQISTLFLCYQLTLIFAQYEGDSLHINLLQFLLLFFPVCISLLKTLIERQKMASLQFASKSLEKQIRMIYYLFKKQIKLKKEQRSLDPLESLFMYSFITNHLRYCKLNRERKAQKQIKMRYKCFCEEYSDNENFRFGSIDQMKIFAKDMISQTLEDEILENQNTYLALIYIYFLVQVKKLPTQAIYEVIRLSLLSKGMAIKEQAIIYKLKYDALEEFDQLVKKNDLKNQKYVFKRVYQYEESLSIIKCNLIILAKQFKEWYSLILTTIIDADQLVQLGFDILNNVTFIEKQLQTAFKINPLSNECDTIYNLFQKYFLFNRVRPKLYRLEGKLVTQFMQSIEKVIFDPGSCVIQITLLQPRGNVIRYTRSFQQAIGFKDEEIQDQNIHRFMPQIIADDHDRYLDNFVERGRIIVVRSEVRVILGKTKGQFLVPINTRLRIETGPTEFGATALITPVNLTFGYMMLNDKGEIEEITQNIFQEMFQKHLGIKINQIRGLDCLFFVPDLAKIWEEIYDENFDKLDRKFECQFIMPMISQSRSTSQTQLTMTKSLFQRQIYRNFENQPTENAIYQVTLHVISLVTINLKLVILELQEFKLLPNQKITSKQLVQLRGRSSQQFQQNPFQQNTSSYREQLSLLNSPWVIDCDLDNQLLQEEERMMDEVKVQLATVNITNTTHQQGQLIQYADDEEDDDEGDDMVQKKERQSQKSAKKQQDEQSITSALKDEDPRKAKNNQINQNASIGSRSSQNNQSQLKRLMKDCFQQARTVDSKLIITLVVFFIFLLSSYIANFIVIFNNFQLIQNNQSSQDLPFQLSYFYNEFVISEYYLQYDSVFSFTSLQYVSLNFYEENVKQIDAVMSILPELNLQTVTLQQQIIEIIKQMINSIQDTDLNSTDYLNNTLYFEQIANALYEADTTHNLINLEYIVLPEEILVVCFMLWYVYKSLMIIKMKSRVYRLFTTFTTDVIQEHYIQFSTLYSLMNTNKFKKDETDEEKFEYNVKSVYVKQGTQIVLEKNQKVGKRMRSQRNNSNQFILILFVIVLIIVFSIYFAGSYFLHSATLNTILEVFKDKKMFSKTYHEITLAYAQSTIFMNSVITSDMKTIQNTTLAELQALQKKISLYTTDQTIYNIIKDQACNIFSSPLSGIQGYDDLFSYEQCSSQQTLQMGLNVILSKLCNIQLQFYEDMVENISQSQLQQRYFSIDYQILRLYDSMGFFVIVSELKNQISQQIENTTKINIILVICCGIFMSLSIIVMIIQKQKLRSDYHKSKQLLTLLPYDRLLENAYIISFIQKDSKLFK